MIKDTRKKRSDKSPKAARRTAELQGGIENGRAGARKKRRSEINGQVLEELTALRKQIDTMVERYTIRVNGQLSELMEVIQGNGEVGQEPNGLTVRAASAILAELKELGLKPKKGRAKDFARVQRLVRRLRELNPVDA